MLRYVFTHGSALLSLVFWRRWRPAYARKVDGPRHQANAWYAASRGMSGADFLPSTAINELEMWQAETFDTATIDRELGWAEGIGMNTMRVFLHNLVWEQDPKAFEKRVDTFLAIAGEPSHPACVCALRFVLGAVSQARSPTPTDSRSAQLGLGAGAWSNDPR